MVSCELFLFFWEMLMLLSNTLTWRRLLHCLNYPWFLWNFLKLPSCGSNLILDMILFPQWCISATTEWVSCIFISIWYPLFIYSSGFTFAYVMDYGIFWSLPHAGISFCLYLLMHHILDITLLDSLDTMLSAGGREWVGARLHDDFPTLPHTKASWFCHQVTFYLQSFGIPQEHISLKLQQLSKASGLDSPRRTLAPFLSWTRY